MKKTNLSKKLSSNFRSYKLSYTILLWGLSGLLSILGNKFGMVYLVLSLLPILIWGILVFNERKDNSL